MDAARLPSRRHGVDEPIVMQRGQIVARGGPREASTDAVMPTFST
jgi:hypothetical protein